MNINFRMLFLSMSSMLIVQAAQASSTVIIDGNTVYSGSGNVTIVNGVIVGGGGKAVQAKGAPQSQARSVGTFTGIRVDAPAQVAWTAGDVPSLKVIAPPNILPLVETKVDSGKLIVKLNGSVSMSSPIQVVAVGQSLEEIKIAGSGSLVATGIHGQSFKVRISGSGEVTASGAVRQVDVGVSGSGDVDIHQIKAVSAKVEVSGSGDVKAFASESADVEVAGSGDVSIYGKPTKRNNDKSGSGNIRYP